MKIFEITTLKEADLSQLSQQIQTLVGNISSKVQSITTQQPATGDNAQQSSGGNGNPQRAINDVRDKILSGEAKLSKDIDAELGKTGIDAQDMHIAIMSKVQDAGNETGQQIAQAAGRTGSGAVAVIDRAKLVITAAAFGYMNKKYLNGDDQNFRGNTMDVIRQIVASNQPRGGAQPVGRQSSARPNGQRGTVPSGGGTNALDAMAADRDF
jgi:hypothetical protein